ncbi:hypothetical protein QYF36_004890 [Acer negundo]|nr:hypothetical protein QYF36_004890 [Acer negundo]
MICVLENLSMRRIMKQPRASSQWKLPLWVLTRLRGALMGEEVENPGEETGDHEIVIPYVGTEKWITSLNLTIQYGWQPWLVDGQVAGYSVVYSQKDYHLTFATVKARINTFKENLFIISADD